MTDRSRDLLTMMKQTAGDAWPELLQEATVSLLVEALLQESGQPDVTHMFEARMSASLVLSLLTASSRLVKYRCPAVEYLCVDWQRVILDKMHNGYCIIVCMHGRLCACFHAGGCTLQPVATTHLGYYTKHNAIPNPNPGALRCRWSPRRCGMLQWLSTTKAERTRRGCAKHGVGWSARACPGLLLILYAMWPLHMQSQRKVVPAKVSLFFTRISLQ